ncbi:MAG: hypothetical protein EP299_10025 [Acidobacteria bacterium]|nr:MAG: hypothetical protein EP299_10025 [Acidobacteriota bacterium]
MASSEQIGDQDQNIKDFVEQAVQKVREEFAHHLTELRRQLGLADREPAPASVAADASQELFAAIAAIDGARSQAEILSTLLDRCCRFAGRSALFLTRQDGLHGWAGTGFNASTENVSDLVMGYGEGTPWSRVATGHGGVSLTGSECAGMCARIDGSHPAEGILIPMVLRDHLAAAIYADRLEDEGSIDLMALQLLTYVAAQAIETLPFRERPTTVTLRLFDEALTAEPGLDLWHGATETTVAPAAMETETVVPEPVTPEVPTVEVVPPEIESTVPEPAAPEIPTVEVVPPEIETVAPEVPTVEEVPAVEVPMEPIGEPWEQDEVVQEDIAPMATAEPEPEAEEVGVDIEELPSPLDTGELQPFASTGFTLEGTEQPEVEVEAEPVVEMGEDASTSTEPTQTFSTGDYVSPAAPPPPAEPIEPTEPIIPTVEAEPVAEPEPVTEPEPVGGPTVAIPTPPARPASRAATEIAPPEDLDGPGWAFTTSQIPAETGDDSLHEEAQRLARLLVTEIKLYNEEEVEEGRRNRNIYQTLREDINRSRQIYEERIDEQIRAETDYFHEELVRILAGGDADALGM